jgi:hypothetical protein
MTDLPPAEKPYIPPPTKRGICEMLPKKKKPKKPRFTATKFLKAWKEHKTKNWDDFVAHMRAASGQPNYSEATIKERIETFSKDLRGAGYKPPKYPKKRRPVAIGAAIALGWDTAD